MKSKIFRLGLFMVALVLFICTVVWLVEYAFHSIPCLQSVIHDEELGNIVSVCIGGIIGHATVAFCSQYVLPIIHPRFFPLSIAVLVMVALLIDFTLRMMGLTI